jgi:hypothetical protein
MFPLGSSAGVAARRAAFAHVAPEAPAASNVATRWGGAAQSQTVRRGGLFAQITTDGIWLRRDYRKVRECSLHFESG